MAAKKTSFLNAIEKKYRLEPTDEIAIQIYIPKSAPGQKDGGEIVVPQELSLHKSDIQCVGDREKIASICNGVTYLDLSENQIADWNEVFILLECMPHCSFLDLRCNPLSSDLTCLNAAKVFPIIAKLVLNDLQLPWNVVLKLLNVFPNVHELHLSLNQYENLDIPEDTVIPQILLLHFNGNHVKNWTEIRKLGKALPNLDTLFLLDNPLGCLPHGNTGEEVKCFPKLKVISVSNSHISSWEELELFRYFPQLTQIRVQGILFLEQYEEKIRRQLILGYLPNITNLNGGVVTDTERQDAERAFIRFYMDKPQPHPERYTELVSIYGNLDPLVQVDLSEDEEHFAHVTVHFNERSYLKQLDLRITLIELRKQLRKEFIGLPKKFLCYHDYGGEEVHWNMEKMIYAERTMRRYEVRTGHKIIIEERN